jgi:acyl phosphate:glycerol-3-phosphate acyltransferase
MEIFTLTVVFLISYLVGAIPFGLIIVRLKSGKDIRTVESGRTGGTNAARAAGFWAGTLTAVMDFLKSAMTVFLVRFLANNQIIPRSAWIEVIAPVLAVLGHNYSIFLLERREGGGLKFRGGAGGAPTTGGAFGLWMPSIFFILPVALFVLFGIGYASLGTISVALTATIIFAYRAWIGVDPWQYIFYGLFTGALLIWALRPNIRRLFQGNERLVGWRARKRNRLQSDNSPESLSSPSSSPSKSSS